MIQMKKNIRFLTFLTAILPSLLLVSCNSDEQIMEQPEKVYYDLAQRRMKANNFFSAIESLEAIEARYPFGRYAEQAQSELIYAYFMRGIASYTRDKGMFARVFKQDLSNRDISGAKQAFGELSEFLTRFPQSQYAPYASQRLIYLRTLIAKNELVAAEYYLKRKAYVAALRRAKYVIENIPNTSETLRALKITKQCYEALGYFNLMEDIDGLIAANSTEEEIIPTEWSWNIFSRKVPAPNEE